MSKSEAFREAFEKWWSADGNLQIEEDYTAMETQSAWLGFLSGAAWSRSQALEEAATRADDIRLQHLAPNDPEEDLIALGAEKAMCAIRVLKEQK